MKLSQCFFLKKNLELGTTCVIHLNFQNQTNQPLTTVIVGSLCGFAKTDNIHLSTLKNIQIT